MKQFNKNQVLNTIFSRNQTDPTLKDIKSKYLQDSPNSVRNMRPSVKPNLRIKLESIRSISTSQTIKTNLSYDNYTDNSQKFLQIQEEMSNSRLSLSNCSTPQIKANLHQSILRRSQVNFSTSLQISKDKQPQIQKIIVQNDNEQLIKKRASQSSSIRNIIVAPPKKLQNLIEYDDDTCDNIDPKKQKRRVSYDLKLIQQHQQLNVKNYEIQSEHYESSEDSLEEKEFENKEFNNNKNGENSVKSVEPTTDVIYVGGFVIKKENRRLSVNNKDQLCNKTTSIFKQLRRSCQFQRKSKFFPPVNTNQDKNNVLGEEEDTTENVAQEEKVVQDCKTVCQICQQNIIFQGILNCCAHKFCFSCISTWNVNQHSCPICFKLFKSIQKIDLNDPNFAAKQIANSILKCPKYLIQQDLLNCKFYKCTQCKSNCCAEFNTKYIYNNEKVICQNCYQSEHKKCQKCQILCQQKLKKFQGLKFCSKCHEEMVNLYCTVCQTMLTEQNKYEKPWKNNEKICKSCRISKFCQFCEESIKKMSYSNLSIGNVCLDCKTKRYCAICKQSVCQLHEKPIEGKHFVYKQHLQQQNKFNVYCLNCNKTQFCKSCDQILKFNKQFKVNAKSDDLMCEECYKNSSSQRTYLKYFKLK